MEFGKTELILYRHLMVLTLILSERGKTGNFTQYNKCTDYTECVYVFMKVCV